MKRFLLIASLLTGTAAPATAADPLPPGCREGAPVTAALSCARERFYFSGSPIHPLIVRDLTSWPTDGGDEVVAVNLIDARRSNRYCCQDGFDAEHRNGMLRVDIDFQRHFSSLSNTLSCANGCWFSYSRTGSDDDGTQILRVDQRTGGSGIFSRLLLLRFRVQNLGLTGDGENYRIGGDRILLEKVGELPLGPGIRMTVRLAGASVTIDNDTMKLRRDTAPGIDP